MQNVAVCTTRGSLASIELFLWVSLAASYLNAARRVPPWYAVSHRSSTMATRLA